MGMIGLYCRIDRQTLDKLLGGEGQAEDYLYGEKTDGSQKLDIDKAWHAIHFTLTGDMFDFDEGNPLGLVVLGGTPMGMGEHEFAPTYLTPEQVRKAAGPLADVTREWFQERFDLEEMLENAIYPVRDDEDGEGFFEYVWSHFLCLQDFFRVAGEQGQCVLFQVG